MHGFGFLLKSPHVKASGGPPTGRACMFLPSPDVLDVRLHSSAASLLRPCEARMSAWNICSTYYYSLPLFHSKYS